jgi:hypothetical protein
VAVKSKTRKRKSKRVRMSEAFRKNCDPILFSQGYRNPVRHDRDRWHTTRRNVFLRWRDEHYDEVYISWGDWGAPYFYLEFRTTQVSRMRPLGSPSPTPRLFHCRLFAWNVSWLSGWINMFGERFGPFMSVNRAIELAGARLIDLEEFLRTGEVTKHISFGANFYGYRLVMDDPKDECPVFWLGMGDPQPPKSAS